MTALVNSYAYASAPAVLTTLAFLTSAVATASGAGSVVVPATIQAGDLLVFIETGISGGAAPATAVPAGFVGVNDNSIFVNPLGVRQRTSVRIATGLEAGTSISGMSPNVADAIELLVFRGDAPIASVTAGGLGGQATTGDPSGQTVTSSGQTAPLVVLGIYYSDVGTGMTPTMSPTEDATITNSAQAAVKYKIYNSTPANVTVDVNDNGSINILQSCYLKVA